MDPRELAEKLADLPLGALRYFERIGSTNDEAAQWAGEEAADLSLVVADEQTAGRGRMRRRWFTPSGAALAFSLVLRPAELKWPQPHLPYSPERLTALGALAVCDAVQELYGLPAQVKWPNDVLLEQRKAAGVLVEATWQGEDLLAAILGIGVNVTPGAVLPDGELIFPATSVESVLKRPVNRLDLLHAILAKLLERRARLASPEFIHAWEERLAFRGEWVNILGAAGSGPPPEGGGGSPREAQVLGLEMDGALRLRDRLGQVFTLQIGEVHLRPVDTSPGSAKLERRE